MTKVTDLEANLEQYNIVQAAINSRAAEQRALLQETIEKNKVEADRQFAEIMNAIKTLQPPATTPLATLPPPLHTQPLQSYPTMSPTFALTQPLLSVSSTEGMFQNFSDVSLVNTGKHAGALGTISLCLRRWRHNYVRLQEEVIEGIFIKGLKQELHTAVQTQKPTGLSQAMELALIIDETRDKRDKGLCYRCDGKFGPIHRCPEKALQVLLVDDDEEEEKEGEYD
ncbi:hypothetical protein Tco_0948392 [Tanacetum coccineum]